MERKEFEESHNQTDVRYIRRHPKHDRFPVRRLGLAALLIAVAMILLVVLPSPWPILTASLCFVACTLRRCCRNRGIAAVF
jgi:hypothetical protein